MFTEQRLNEAYQGALKRKINDQSKYIFFSDQHRGDDSVSDEFQRNQMLFIAALEYYNKEGYTYVELGDGDELWEHKEFRHIRIAHSDVFTTMKKFYDDHRMIMIYGNHNMKLRDPDYVAKNYYYYYDEYEEKNTELFPRLKPVEALVLMYEKTGQHIFAVHGHQGDAANDQFWIPTMLSVRYFWRFIHLVGFKNPASPSKNQTTRHIVEKHYSKWVRKNRVMLICGHTHRMKFPKRGEVPYFNCGCCIHSKGINGIEILNGKIMVVQWRVVVDENQYVRVKRTIIRGPQDISSFYSK